MAHPLLPPAFLLSLILTIILPYSLVSSLLLALPTSSPPFSLHPLFSLIPLLPHLSLLLSLISFPLPHPSSLPLPPHSVPLLSFLLPSLHSRSSLLPTDYQSLRIGGLIIAGILFILGILIILSEYPYRDSCRESAGVCPNPVQSPLRLQPRPYQSPWPRPYFCPPASRPRLRPCLCPSPIAALGPAPSTPPSAPPPLLSPPPGPPRLRPRPRPRPCFCRSPFPALGSALPLLLLPRASRVSIAGPAPPCPCPTLIPRAAPALASASSGSLCRVERNLSSLLPTPPPTGRRCRCKFNQQQR